MANYVRELDPLEQREQIMTALYRRLRTEPPAIALARMQAERWRAGPSAPHWAGLVFYGNE